MSLLRWFRVQLVGHLSADITVYLTPKLTNPSLQSSHTGLIWSASDGWLTDLNVLNCGPNEALSDGYIKTEWRREIDNQWYFNKQLI